jgi:hypothetical protein
MDGERTQKPCRYCLEPMDARAKRCPHCRSQQTSWAYVLHPAVPGLLMLLPVVVFVAFGAFMQRSFGPGKDFTRYEGQLVAVDVRMECIQEEDAEPLIRIGGRIQNNSPVRWQDVETECRFLDAEGCLVDVNNDVHTATVRPGRSRNFEIYHVAHLPVADYAAYEVSVKWAKEAK